MDGKPCHRRHPWQFYLFFYSFPYCYKSSYFRDLNCYKILYLNATDLKLGSSTYFFLLFSFLVLTKCQVLNLMVGRSRDQVLQRANWWYFTILWCMTLTIGPLTNFGYSNTSRPFTLSSHMTTSADANFEQKWIELGLHCFKFWYNNIIICLRHVSCADNATFMSKFHNHVQRHSCCARDPVHYTQFALRLWSLLVHLVVSFSVAIKRL